MNEVVAEPKFPLEITEAVAVIIPRPREIFSRFSEITPSMDHLKKKILFVETSVKREPHHIT